MKPLVLLESGQAPALCHMQRDSALLESLTDDLSPILHHYDWLGDSLTYGYFIKPQQMLHMEALERSGLQIARRPTGGGVIFHLSDLAFSVLIPATHPAVSLNTLQNYALINGAVLRAIQRYLGQERVVGLLEQTPCAGEPKMANYCMAQPTRYDLLLYGKKVGGAAQRRTHRGLLHQGSIYLATPPRALLMEVLRDGERVISAMECASKPLLTDANPHSLKAARADLRKLIYESLADALNPVYSRQ